MKTNSKKNVIYIFADQLSLKSLQMYGNTNKVHTPNLDSIANNGVRFTNSYCTTPQCSPSRSSLLTGLYPSKTRVFSNVEKNGVIEELNPDFTTIGSYLKKNGYNTGYFGKWHLGTPIGEFGFDQWTRYDRGNADEDPDITKDVLEFLGDQGSEPWGAIVSYENPHDIYRIRKMLENKVEFDISDIKLPESFYRDDLREKPSSQQEFRDEDQGAITKGFSEEDWKCYLAYYYNLIETLDKEIGQILDLLKKKGQYENTIIVFSADHGDLMGAHRCPFKGPMMYDELIKIPFLISCPNLIPLNEVRDQLTVNIDVFPTICDLLELEIPNGLDGVSLKQCILNKEAKTRDNAFVEYHSKQNWRNPIRSVINSEFKYNFYLSGEEELYDIKNDTAEVTNLARNSEFATIKEGLRNVLEDRIKQENDPFYSYKRTTLHGDLI